MKIEKFEKDDKHKKFLVEFTEDSERISKNDTLYPGERFLLTARTNIGGYFSKRVIISDNVYGAMGYELYVKAEKSNCYREVVEAILKEHNVV